MTESIICTFTPAGKSREGSCGVPVPNVCAAIVDPNTNEFVPPGVIGEIIVSGPGVMKGYWQLPEETAEMFVEIDGRKWLKTGDLMRADDDGFFYFYDRMKDLIKVRGMSVFAREIEEVLYNHPQVKAAGVIGIPDAKIGNLIKANIVLQAEARGKISEDEIIEYCKERLSFYKVPHIVEFRGELPKTDMGKISRRELRDEEEVS